jgi:hypothetical protein
MPGLEVLGLKSDDRESLRLKIGLFPNMNYMFSQTY